MLIWGLELGEKAPTNMTAGIPPGNLHKFINVYISDNYQS